MLQDILTLKLYMKNVDKNSLTISLKFLQCQGKGTYKKQKGGGLLYKNSTYSPFFCLVKIYLIR